MGKIKIERINPEKYIKYSSNKSNLCSFFLEGNFSVKLLQKFWNDFCCNTNWRPCNKPRIGDRNIVQLSYSMCPNSSQDKLPEIATGI